MCNDRDAPRSQTKKDPIKLAPVRDSPNTRLLEAASRGDAAGVRDALGSGAFINTRDADSRTAMHLAAQRRHTATLKVPQTRCRNSWY